MEEMTTVTISVTQRHIDEGVSSDCRKCAIALAVNDAIPGSDSEVTYSRAWIKGCGYYLPREAKNFIVDFDEGEPVAPFAFSLPIPARLLTQGSQA